MKNKTFISLIVLFDIVASALALVTTFIIRFRLDIIPSDIELYYSDLIIPAVVLYLYWLVFYFYKEMYTLPVAPSRLDESMKVVKAHVLGIIFLFLITFDIYHPLSLGRVTLFIYMILMSFFTILGRVILISIQRSRYKAGIGLKNILIVGFNDFGFDIFDKIWKFPALGYRVVGFATIFPEKNLGKEYKGFKVLGGIDDLPGLIENQSIEELVIAFDSSEHDKLLDVISKVGRMDVGLKIIPDMYDIISGQARTHQIYGFPLIDIFPQLMPRWEKMIKRGIDIIVSIIALLFFAVLYPFLAIIIKLDSKGPVFYSQDRVGKNGREFKIIKLRTMVSDAEKQSGPVWSQKNDPRITKVGDFLRKSRIDEIPQFINVLRNEMSLVGPRPERKVFVDQFIEDIPLYKHRLKMKPGITGWAQIKHKYDESFDDVKVKLEYDLFYLENMSLRLDVKIILNTLSVMLSRKGQ